VKPFLASRTGSSTSEPAATPAIRPIVLLSAAAFASAAPLRVADPLLPQIAGEFATTAGGASVIATYFAVSYGLCQIFVGALGDRFGKYTVIAVATFLSGLTAAAGAFAGSLAMLGVLRLLSGATAGAIIPLAMAYLGDVIPYAQRQTMLARFLSGQILGVIFGQVFGGLFGDTIGWRGVFIVLGAIYFAIAALLVLEIRSPRVAQHRSRDGGALIARNLALLRIRRVRIIIFTAFIEGFFFFGGFVYLGAYLRQQFALSYLAVGTLLAFFGLGGLVYASAVRPLVARLGERGLALVGGLTLAVAFALAAAAPAAWHVAPAIAAIGTGFYMLHNTLQTNATQMAPEARGLAISLFAFCYFLGQAAGVAASGWGVDAFGYRTVFVAAGAALLVIALAFRATLAKPPAAA
jgi:MFS transporter, YNFM family, putative membrane transport protein